MSDNRPLSVRFERFVERDPNSGCWLWSGCVDYNRAGQPYAKFKVGKMVRASRWVLENCLGRKLTVHEVARHRCDISICVNPDHIEVGTQKDNVRDRYDRGRAFHHRGETHWRVKRALDAMKEGE